MSASKLACCHQFQSTLPVGGATRRVSITKDTYDISIHAPRGGSDPKHLIIGFFPWYFNPRSPWGERLRRFGLIIGISHFNPRSPWGERHQSGVPESCEQEFQSTLPVGGATTKGRQHRIGRGNFNPRSPWGERHRQYQRRWTQPEFQSTLPVGGATTI